MSGAPIFGMAVDYLRHQVARITAPKHSFNLWQGDPRNPTTRYCNPGFEGRYSTWSDSDNPENYQNRTVANSIPCDYTPESFGYLQNKQGFRCDDFDGMTKNSPAGELRIAFVGCSITYGVGVPLEVVWAHQLVTYLRSAYPHLRIPYINLAKGGKSIDYCVRVLKNFTDHVDVDLVLLLLPDPRRAELCLHHQSFTEYLRNFSVNAPHLPDKERRAIQAWDDNFSCNENFLQYSLLKNFSMLDLLSEARNFSYLWSTWYEPMTITEWVYPQHRERCLNVPFQSISPDRKLARDGMHPSAWSHRAFVEGILPSVLPRVEKILDSKTRT